jgi:hypothetical protein
LYGCETWSLTLREEQGVEENIWPLEGWNNRKLEKMHNEEIHNLYSSPNIIRMIRSRKIRWAGQ